MLWRIQMSQSKDCQHELQFLLTSVNREASRLGFPAVWQCPMCSFYLPFDPASYPDGVAYTTGPKEDKSILPTPEYLAKVR